MLDVLVVDDSMIMRRNIKKYLTSLGHNIIGEAPDGEYAISFCKLHKPNLVTMDISMPGINGIEVVKELLKIDGNLSIIMITAYGQNNLVKEALNFGAKGFILKPVSEKKLYDSIIKIYPDYAN